ncbi:hypothetical protein [Nostoc sp. 'Peltigera membranacea cyanobiont' N6]|nr:hypothetical protein [Nostoc sp. 'Peltigera membranacea cyanobiont' N6]
MANEPIIRNERVDDIPILLTQIEGMGVQSLIDKPTFRTLTVTSSLVLN